VAAADAKEEDVQEMDEGGTEHKDEGRRRRKRFLKTV
jgi:hypothetical protein